MNTHHVRISDTLIDRQTLQRINESRAAAIYGVWRAATEAIGDAVRTLADRVAEWQRRQANRNAIARLDDHSLRDIGLSRAEADAIASGRAVTRPITAAVPQGPEARAKVHPVAERRTPTGRPDPRDAGTRRPAPRRAAA